MKIITLLFALMLTSSVNINAQLSTDFKKADSIAARYEGYSLKNLNCLTAKLTTPLSTDVEKFRAIYKWICDNIAYDYTLFLKNQHNQAKLKNNQELAVWNKVFTKLVFKKLVNNRKTVCSGYAYLLKEMATQAGLTCIVIDGYGRTSQSNIRGTGTPNHSWNAVQLHGVWYLCDPTWSSGAYDTQQLTSVKNFDDSYFLPALSLFIRNHYPLDSNWMLLKNKPTLQTFLNAPLVYKSVFQYQVSQLYPETFDVAAVKGKAVTFSFRSANDKMPINKVVLCSKLSGSAADLYNPKVYTDDTGLYHVDQVFTTKGKHLVHVMLNTSYVITYSVNVQ